MSARNGDKSRFHRQRKQKIARRKRTVALVERARTQGKPAAQPQLSTGKSVSA
jgi:hypothetical protein